MKSKYQSETEMGLAMNLRKVIEKAKNSDPNKKKIYFAGPWFTVKADVMYEACKKIYLYSKDKCQYTISFPKDIHLPTAKETFDEDVRLIKECDVMVALVDDKDVGTAWEIGMAYILGKPIYLLGYDESTFSSKTNLMLAFTGKCFTIDKFYKFLTGGLGTNEFVKFSDKWEDIE